MWAPKIVVPGSASDFTYTNFHLWEILKLKIMNYPLFKDIHV